MSNKKRGNCRAFCLGPCAVLFINSKMRKLLLFKNRLLKVVVY